MHSRLYRKLGRSTLAVVSVLALAGCVQATRHSNTMIFGTNTTVGFKVGQNVNQVPEIMLAYDRQEAVIMPLLANVQSGSSDHSLLEPCNPMPVARSEVVRTEVRDGRQSEERVVEQVGSASGQADGAVPAIHPCSFVGYRSQGNTVYVQDSYSVLASFGADFTANAAAGADATAGLAQYFATGIAAQLLAVRGGAALVATGAASRESAEGSSDAGIASLITGSTAYSAPTTAATDEAIEDQIVAKIGATAPANLAARLAAFDTALGGTSGAVAACQGLTPAVCAERIDSRDVYAEIGLTAKAVAVATGLTAWTTP